MIKKLDKYHTSNIHDVVDKINEIIDFLNDTFLMRVKDGQYGSTTLATDTVSELNGTLDCIVNGIVLNDDIKCPHCGASYYMEGSSVTTLAYYPPIWKDGVNINPDCNTITTHCKCLNCGKEFDI